MDRGINGRHIKVIATKLDLVVPLTLGSARLEILAWLIAKQSECFAYFGGKNLSVYRLTSHVNAKAEKLVWKTKNFSIV
jgi:hypothetical protein